jgi:hypothetical protein
VACSVQAARESHDNLSTHFSSIFHHHYPKLMASGVRMMTESPGMVSSCQAGRKKEGQKVGLTDL